MFHRMPFILLAMILAIILLDPWIPLTLKSFLFAMSLTVKSCIIFILPLIIFGLLFKVSVQLSGQATKIILLIFAGVCCSNFISTFLSQFVGIFAYRFDLSLMNPNTQESLTPLWSLQLPKMIANDKAMYIAIISGLLISFLKPKFAQKCAMTLSIIVDKILILMTYLIPLFIAGFVVKLNQDGVIHYIIHDYALIFMLIFAAQFSYITLIYLLNNRLQIAQTIACLKNMIPAAIAGFSSMSSATAMPLTIMGTEKNAKEKDLARSIIPATVNIHLIGDCFAIPILAFAILKSYGMPEPVILTYLIFAFYFVLAKFSVAAVPGGGIIVMLPILEAYLGFNGEMLSLITALYILFDPVITCANVLGNGGFAMTMDKLLSRLNKNRLQTV